MRSNNHHAVVQLAILSLVAVLVLAACAPTVAPQAAPAPATVPTQAPPAPAQYSSNSITAIVWQWTSLVEVGNTTIVPDPANYTIVFNVDGTVMGKADCNTFNGTYSQQNGFTIKVTPSAMSACGTLDSQYLILLNQVAAGGPDGAGGLALETAGGAQRMMFKNGGPAPAAPPPSASNSITGTVWQWTSLTQQGVTTAVPDPANYTIIFNTDGTVKGKADCNTFSGTYSQANGFSIKVTPDVMSACGTLDSQYITLLNQVAAGGPDGAGGLALETAGGAQRMQFKNGGAAPK